jgi:hypothetical protein
MDDVRAESGHKFAQFADIAKGGNHPEMLWHIKHCYRI